eukprot:Amastigsp_a339490_9.p6 type:complete len:104 gc:universal Amastigsp_a339490_9:552-241(-)
MWPRRSASASGTRATRRPRWARLSPACTTRRWSRTSASQRRRAERSSAAASACRTQSPSLCAAGTTSRPRLSSGSAPLRAAVRRRSSGPWSRSSRSRTRTTSS